MAVLDWMTDNAGRNGVLVASIEEIATGARVSERSAKRATKQIVETGWASSHRPRNGRCNQYDLSVSLRRILQSGGAKNGPTREGPKTGPSGVTKMAPQKSRKNGNSPTDGPKMASPLRYITQEELPSERGSVNGSETNRHPKTNGHAHPIDSGFMPDCDM
jgi:hypothetical protein